MKRLVSIMLAGLVIWVGLAAGPAEAKPPPVNKATSITVILIENHNEAQVRKSMPATAAYGRLYARATNAHSCWNAKHKTHPSKPNYLCLVSGNAQGESSNRWATEKAGSIFDRAAHAGYRVKTYMDGMGADNCRMANYHKSRRHHNPNTFFTYGKVRLPNKKLVSK